MPIKQSIQSSPVLRCFRPVEQLRFNSSGDIFLAFSTGNHVHHGEAIATVRMLSPDNISPLFQAAAEATEEAILNALTAAETIVGLHGRTAHALPHDLLTNVMHRYRPAR
jgi:D-aminopeptidase